MLTFDPIIVEKVSILLLDMMVVSSVHTIHVCNVEGPCRIEYVYSKRATHTIGFFAAVWIVAPCSTYTVAMVIRGGGGGVAEWFKGAGFQI